MMDHLQRQRLLVYGHCNVRCHLTRPDNYCIQTRQEQHVGRIDRWIKKDGWKDAMCIDGYRFAFARCLPRLCPCLRFINLY